MKKIFLLPLIVLPLLAGAAPARAQSCDTAFEAIITLHPPRLGVPTVWDAMYGKRDIMTQLASGVAKPEGTVMTLGRTLAKDSYVPQDLVLAEINRRGRVLNEKNYPVKNGESPVKLISLKDGYLAVGNIAGDKGRRRVRLSWYGADGGYRHEKILQDEVYDYDALGLLAAADDAGFVTVIHAVNHGQESDHNGLLMRFAPDGREIWKRAYRPGIPNEIDGVITLDDGGYLAMGQIRLDDARMAGWVMKLGADGTVLWQRTYPRGRSSMLSRATQVSSVAGQAGRGFLVFGDTSPLDNGQDAAWLMAIDPLGEPVWQRYFRQPDFALSGFGLMRNEDGRIVVAMNASAAPGSGRRDHVRMLILSPRGVIVEDESYIEGVRAQGHDFVRGVNGERVVTATVTSDSNPINRDLIGDDFIVAQAISPDGTIPGGDPKEQVSRGWVFLATALDPYADPCELSRGGAPSAPQP